MDELNSWMHLFTPSPAISLRVRLWDPETLRPWDSESLRLWAHCFAFWNDLVFFPLLSTDLSWEPARLIKYLKEIKNIHHHTIFKLSDINSQYGSFALESVSFGPEFRRKVPWPSFALFQSKKDQGFLKLSSYKSCVEESLSSTQDLTTENNLAQILEASSVLQLRYTLSNVVKTSVVATSDVNCCILTAMLLSINENAIQCNRISAMSVLNVLDTKIDK